jgi:regulator of protease activity HflC (stomatin/prohibitin superfamily)
MGVLHETLPTAALYNNPQQLMITATGSVALIGTAAKTFEVVHQGEMGVRMRRGRPVERKRTGVREGYRTRTEEEIAEEGRYKIYGPGAYVLIPFFEKIVKVNVNDRADEVEPFNIESSDGQLHTVEASFIWQVLRFGDYPYNALFNVNNEKDNKDKDKYLELKQAVLSIGVGGLGRVLGGKAHTQDVTTPTQEQCQENLLKYGSAINAVVLKPVTRAHSEVLKQGLERSGNPISGMVVASQEADEHGYGRVIPVEFGGDAA